MNKSLANQFFKYVSGNVAGMIGVSVYVLADTLFISLTAGADGITLLNLALPLYSIIFAIGSMIGIGFATRYAIRKAQKKENIEGYFTQALMWQIIFAIPFILLGIFSPQTWIQAMGGDAGIVALGIPYVKIVLLGAPFFMMNYSFTAFARNDNAPTVAMLAALIASTFNIIFDYIFIFPCGMGLKGAALATAMSPVVSSLVCCRHFLSKKSTIRLTKTVPSIKRLFSCAKLGVSAFVGEMSSAVTTIIFNYILLELLGNTGVAAYGVVANYAIVSIAIFNGIAQGMQPLFSNYYGLGKKAEVHKLLRMGLFMTAVSAIAMVTIAWMFTPQLVSVFNSEANPVLADYAFLALRYYFIGFLFAGFNIVMITYFSSIAEAAKASAASVLRGFIAIIGCAITLSILFGVTGVWLSFMAAEAITFIVVLFFCLQMRRTKPIPRPYL